ncbi:hypothetical protein C9374_002704 [Naegleria lovaniensis]|uniref:Protein phosphatase 1 regulatory subunit 21 N-terminal domain-containing protein n=1 Tax=Naegleria lovaniensis TaxID=51637 RepID=A0AA88KL02_NAELO|nr:uncharacterized protein C9374_002704 [Naegleria lovaniensis]KAG2386258.1 hypothetical protein C9374_002704 [Naegleria lovaniensis]
MTTSSLKQQQHSKSSEHYSQPPQQTPLLSMTSTSHQHDPLSHPTTTSDDDTNMQIVALSKDKYEKLIKEFQKYKQKYNKWKKIVNQEESKWKQTQIDLEKKESELRNKIEENDILTFNNQRLEKRMAQLMFDLEEQVNKNRKSTSFFSGLFGTSSSSAGGAGSGGGAGNDQPSIHGGNASTFSFFGTSSNNSSMYNELQVLKEELESKIKENEAMKDKMRNLKQEIRNRKDSENTIRNFTVKQHSKLIYYENYIDRKILFDDTKIDSLNLLNIPNCKRNPLEIELLDNLTSILNNLSKNISSTYLYIPQKIQHLNKLTTSQSPLLRFINSKMNTQIDMSTFPNLFSKIIKQCEWYSKSIKDQGTHESSGTSNSSMNSGISTNSGISNNSSSNSNSNNNNTSSSSNNNNISNHNSSIRMDESSGNVQIDSNTIITTHHTTSLLHTLFSTVKDLLKYNRKCLLYLTVTSQEEECELREVYHSSSSTTMDSSLNHTFKGTTTTSLDMTDGNDNDDDEYSEFEDGIFMRNTMATRSLKYLLYLYDKFILFIDTFYVRVLEIENYVPIQTSLRRDEKKIRRVFLMTSHDEDHHSSSSSNSTSVSNNEQHLSSLSVDHYSHGEQFIHKLLKSSSNHHVNSTCFNNFSIREEFKLLVKHIGDALKDYTEIVSNLLLKENIKNFISPSIKNINEKLIKSLKSIVLLYESMTIIHRGLMDCERQYDQLYSRGALVDYESILTNKVTHVRNIVNYSGQSGPYRMIQSHDGRDGRDGRDGSDGRYSMIHHDHPLPTMDNDAYNILDTPYYYSSCYYYTMKKVNSI